jgi:hypothetical protein
MRPGTRLGPLAAAAVVSVLMWAVLILGVVRLAEWWQR